MLKMLGVPHTGTSTASELSQPTDDYADLVARLQSMCFGGLLGDPLGMGVEGRPSEEEQRTASTGSVGRFESAGSAQHSFDLDLGALTSQPQAPHTVSLPSDCSDCLESYLVDADWSPLLSQHFLIASPLLLLLCCSR